MQKQPLIASAVEEEEPVDKKDEFEAACAESAECKPVKMRLDSCAERVSANPGTEETCVEVRPVTSGVMLGIL